MADDLPKGPVTPWVSYGSEGWQPTDFPTISAAIASEKYTSRWVITRPLNWQAAVDALDATPADQVV